MTTSRIDKYVSGSRFAGHRVIFGFGRRHHVGHGGERDGLGPWRANDRRVAGRRRRRSRIQRPGLESRVSTVDSIRTKTAGSGDRIDGGVHAQRCGRGAAPRRLVVRNRPFESQTTFRTFESQSAAAAHAFRARRRRIAVSLEQHSRVGGRKGASGADQDGAEGRGSGVGWRTDTTPNTRDARNNYDGQTETEA